MSWAAPIQVDDEKNAQRQVTRLLQSSPASWLTSDTNVTPRVTEAGTSGFVPEGERGQRLLGVLVEGRFDSFFKDKESPLLAADEAAPDEADAEESADDEDSSGLGVVADTIERSPESARLFVFSSNDFLGDQILRMIGSAEGTFYTNSIQLMANVVDWSTEDRSLLSIRSRGNFNRTLPPMPQERQTLIEYANYGVALLGIGLVYLLHRRRQAGKRRRHEAWLAEAAR